MSEELDKLLADKKEAPASGEKTPEQLKEEEKAKSEEHLANIKKAISEGNDELKKIRAAKKGNTVVPNEEEVIPEIDFTDKGAKAWEKHIDSKFNPLQDEMSREKEEIRTFAIQQFLRDKPELAKNPEKVKQVIKTYEKIRTATERTTEGVLIDLRKAYAAEFAEEIIQASEQERMARAQGDVMFSAPAVSYNDSSSFRTEHEKVPHISQEDAAILSKWGMTPAEWIKEKKAQEKKS